jgi:hypothetical protein
MGFALGDLLDSCVFGSCWAGQFFPGLEVFCLILSRVPLPCWLCFGGVFAPGPREVIEALWNICCATVVATGLTGSVHRPNRLCPPV